MQSLRLCVFLAFIAVLRCYDLSPTLAEFYCMYSGVFTNRKQVETDATHRTLIYFKSVPIEIPALSQLPALYLEEVADGALVLAEVGVVTEGDDGTVYIDPYNFTGNTGYDPRTFDPASLKSLNWDQVQGHSDCRDAYVRVKPLTFTVSWADCRHAAVNGVRYKIEALLTCDNITAIFSAGDSETPTLVPYNYQLQGHKFSLPNAPDGYVCNCDHLSG